MAHSSFYVTLNSRANENEFPDNKSHRFKNRLHHPLILREPGWRVGLSSLCLRAVKSDLFRNVLPSQGDKKLINWGFWIDQLIKLNNSRKYMEESVEINVKQMEMKGYVTSGVAMMAFFADQYNQYRNVDASEGHKMVSSTGKKYYLDVKMDGDELVIDNSNVHRSTKNGRPIIKFNKKLALKMNWFTDTGDRHYNLKLGPNLIMSFDDPTIPDVLDVIDEENNQTIFWKEVWDDVQLSVFCNWRFVNLNEAFRANWQVDDRTLYALSDVVSSSIVGDKTEDLLRSFHYKREADYDMFHFEPQTIHYRPVRKAFFEITETSFTETDGRQVKFNSGDCTVGLHFKRDFLAT